MFEEGHSGIASNINWKESKKQKNSKGRFDRPLGLFLPSVLCFYVCTSLNLQDKTSESFEGLCRALFSDLSEIMDVSINARELEKTKKKRWSGKTGKVIKSWTASCWLQATFWNRFRQAFCQPVEENPLLGRDWKLEGMGTGGRPPGTWQEREEETVKDLTKLHQQIWRTQGRTATKWMDWIAMTIGVLLGDMKDQVEDNKSIHMKQT